LGSAGDEDGIMAGVVDGVHRLVRFPAGPHRQRLVDGGYFHEAAKLGYDLSPTQQDEDAALLE